ncbi:dihydrodipicolinate reductase [Pseudooceanicola sp. 216_PA32_1]|jgi:hypothetical protein|uniref:Dihydrodipicolinate reductase n=1 Tax=Pseudooceanicola pacificus TaxID=2676438 RepID=A0A844WAP2_9RHOB|nr:dihydrodipicolinate reductase [Pseudooceanicola pacificus]MWB76802.1 dihydrodipicolinate reductase [Pseudooceanicola pacificus]
MSRIALAALVLASLTTAAPLAAEDGRRVTGRSEFLSLVKGRQLTYTGVALTVTEDGRILGRAFGREVTGNWNWQDGYFCRTMQWGSRQFEANCQAVELEGSRLRFTSDRGTGDHARLTLQ